MRVKSNVMAWLVLVNVLWAANPVMQKFLLADFAPVQVAWLRMVVGAGVAAVVWLGLRGRGKGRITNYELRITNGRGKEEEEFEYEYEHEYEYEKEQDCERGRKDLVVRAVGMGVVVFFVTPLLITHGLDASLAVHNAFITGLEPVITIVLARIFLRERMRATGWMILAIALAGFALLSGVGGSWRELVRTTYLFGNVLLLLGMAGEAMYSILGAPLAKRMEPVKAFLIALGTGAALLTVFVMAMGMTPSVGQFTARSAIGLLWTGPITTAFCYLVWLTSLRHVPVNAAAFTLFIQPVLGAVMGYGLLGERLGGMQVVGGGLILVSLGLYGRGRTSPLPPFEGGEERI